VVGCDCVCYMEGVEMRVKSDESYVKSLCWCKVGRPCEIHANASWRLRIYKPRFISLRWFGVHDGPSVRRAL